MVGGGVVGVVCVCVFVVMCEVMLFDGGCVLGGWVLM